MNISEGEGVNAKAFRKHDEIERKKIDKLVPKARASQIYQELDNDIIPLKKAISQLSQNINKEEVIDGIARLVAGENVIMTKSPNNITYLRKNTNRKPKY